jgi:hypothetical protein
MDKLPLKRLVFAILACPILAPAIGCTRAAPDAGETAVLIRKPWFMGHGGVVPEAVTTGLTFAAFTTSVKYVSITPQAFDIQYSDIMSSDGIPLDFHATLTLQVIDPVVLVRDFSGGGANNGTENTVWYTNNIYPVVNNYVRDAFKGHDMHSLAIDTTGTNAVETDVKRRMAEYVLQHHIPVNIVNFTLGRINPPQMIKNQRIRTAEEQQRQQTELQTKIAEDNRKAAEAARADADDAYRQHMGLTPEQFVELQRINMMAKVCAEQHCTFVVGNATPIISGK